MSQAVLISKTDRSVSITSNLKGDPVERPLHETISPKMRLLITAIVMAATMMEFLDTSIVNVALPNMMGNLGATLDQIGWVSTGYIITNVVVLPLTGWLSDYFGRRLYLFGSIVLFTIASFGCGISSSLGALIFWRVIQGAGGAAFLSTAQATLMEIYAPAKRAAAQAIFAMGVTVAPTLGPTLGGFITDNYSWPWIFFINIPIGVLAALLAIRYLPDSRAAGAKRRADFIGIGLLAVGLGSMQTVLERGERDDWFSATYIVVLSGLAILGCASFIWWVLRPGNRAPAVNLRVIQNRNLAAGTVYGFAFGVVFYGVIFVVPQYLQSVQAHTAEQAGIIMLPGALCSGAMLPLVARIMGKVDARAIIGIGMLALIGSMFFFSSRLTLTMPDEAYLIPLALRGVGTGLQLVPLSVVALGTLRPQQVADGAGLFNLFRQLGGSFGIAGLTTLLDRRESFHHGRLTEFIYPGSPEMDQRIEGVRSVLVHHGVSPADSYRPAMAVVERAVSQQASLMAFRDLFVSLLVICAAALVLLVLFQRPRKGAAPAADAH
jgi:DHA2 family multidrug resistance protein